MDTIRVRYMVRDVDPAVTFYTKYLGFQIKQEASETPLRDALSRATGLGVEYTVWPRRGGQADARRNLTPNQAAGTESSSMLTTSRPRLRNFARPTSTFGTKSQPAPADLRFC
jgi:catechol 2,3-dioxygenase-like lactoylglutathione lyase family enzyme